jgi:Hemerythrin HHE cation binding domain
VETRSAPSRTATPTVLATSFARWPLVAEHRELAALLDTVDATDPNDQQRIRDAVAELHEHIRKEEDGLFPASLTSLSGADWNIAMDAWQAAHPDTSPIED